MIVILEGLERTGKTTLAKIFEERGFVNFKDHNHLRDSQYVRITAEHHVLSHLHSAQTSVSKN